jgi:hypothetical protein
MPVFKRRGMPGHRFMQHIVHFAGRDLAAALLKDLVDKGHEPFQPFSRFSGNKTNRRERQVAQLGG